MALDEHARQEWPETIEIDGETYEEESLGAYKRVYRSLDEENVGVVSSRGATFEEQALHTAGIIQNEQVQRNNGITTATTYTPAKAEVDGQAYPALVGSFRDDLVTHDELDEMLEDKGFQERVYREIFQPVKELAEEGKTTASPLDFINIDNRNSSNLIFDTRNFGYNPATDGLEVLDNGELEPNGYNASATVPEADLSDLPYAEPEDFAYQRPHDSLEEFIEDNKVDQKAQQMMSDLF
ncbi:MAG: hypothetical protein ABEJ07_03665 [Candidatus Nanohaloarchaea archaeon]